MPNRVLHNKFTARRKTPKPKWGKTHNNTATRNLLVDAHAMGYQIQEITDAEIATPGSPQVSEVIDYVKLLGLEEVLVYYIGIGTFNQPQNTWFVLREPTQEDYIIASQSGGSGFSSITEATGGFNHDPGDGGGSSLIRVFRTGANDPDGGVPPAPPMFVNTTSGNIFYYRSGAWKLANYEDHGNILYVATTGSDTTGAIGNPHLPYLTIAAAITAASNGDKIVVLNGTFTENITINKQLRVVFLDNAKLSGTVVISSSQVVLNAQGGISVNDAGAVVTVSGSVSNVEIQGKIKNLGAGPAITANSPFIANKLLLTTSGTEYITGTATVKVMNSYAAPIGGIGAGILYQVDVFTEDNDLDFVV